MTGSWILVLILGTLIETMNCVKVSIYYEVLCPDSINFINKQLYPSYYELKKHLDLEFVPFGKATHNLVNGTWRFQCQHGEDECEGNKYQACALDQNKGQDTDVAFVRCVLRRYNHDVERIRTCAKTHNLNWTDISECATSKRGDSLLAHYGDKTNNLTETISFVPTIVYNDVQDESLQIKSLYNFAGVVCSKIDNKPPYCDDKQLSQRKSFFFW